MSRPYCDQTILDFYRTVERVSNTNQCLPRYIFEDEHYDTKFSRKITNLPFSILVLESSTTPSAKRYYILTDMHVGSPGAFGRIKVAYPIILKDNFCTVDFSRPTAIKITSKIYSVSEDAQNLMSETFKDIYSRGIWTHYTEAGNRSKFYYTMPLYQGQELFYFIDSYIKKREHIPLTLALNIMFKLSEELKKIHELGYVHLDIKPENIIIHLDPSKKTMDIRLIDWDFLLKKNAPLTKTCGTENFIAPEVIDIQYTKELIKVDPSMDIYSLGKVFNDIINNTDLSSVSDDVKFEIKLLNRNTTALKKRRVDLSSVLKTLQDLFTQTQEVLSHGEIENSSLLPESFNSYIQLNIMPKARPDTPPLTLVLSDISNSPQKPRPAKRKAEEYITYNAHRQPPIDLRCYESEDF